MHTVHGIGYRLDVDVHCAERAAVSAPLAVSVANDAELELDDPVGRVPFEAAADPQTISIARPPWSRTWPFAVLALVALLLVSMAWIFYADHGGPAQPSANAALEARHLLQGEVTLSTAAKMQTPFRQLVADAPIYARGHAGLALALNQMSFMDPEDAAAKHREAVSEAQLALQMDPSLVDAYVVLGDAACREANWKQCMLLLKHGLELAPADSILRMWTSRHLLTMGYLTEALEEIKIGYAADPLSQLINYQLARVLDALGRHDEAQHHLLIGGVTRQASFWFNAVWRGDLTHLQQFVPDDPRFASSYAAVGAALRDAREWPAARRAIDASEIPGKPRSNWLRMIDPRPHNIAENIAMMERIWRTGYSGMDSMFVESENGRLPPRSRVSRLHATHPHARLLASAWLAGSLSRKRRGSELRLRRRLHRPARTRYAQKACNTCASVAQARCRRRGGIASARSSRCIAPHSDVGSALGRRERFKAATH